MPRGIPPGWQPTSPCTPACLPVVVVRDRLRVGVRLVVRLFAVSAVLITAVATVSLVQIPHRQAWVSALSRAMLRATGVRLRVRGAVVGGPGVLVVANHVSWIDVLALGAVAPVRMVAKREVGGWPLIGGLARRAGALFIDREGLRELPRTIAAVAAALRAGGCVAAFPEGTTWCGASRGPFRRAAFQAAVDAGAPVQPVAISFRLADGGPARTAAFVGTQTLWDSVRRVLATPGLTCELVILSRLAPVGDRRTLARRAEDAIATVTGVEPRDHLVPGPEQGTDADG